MSPSARAGLPAHCYLVGRIVFHHSVDELLSTFIVLFQLIWRLLHYSVGKSNVLGAVIFLMHDGRDMEQFQSLLAR